jgi:hypothetical protein
MRIRFQADADLDERIVRGLKRRQRAVDFRMAAESGLIGVPDPEVLRIAAELDRILVSHDDCALFRLSCDKTVVKPSLLQTCPTSFVDVSIRSSTSSSVTT